MASPDEHPPPRLENIPLIRPKPSPAHRLVFTLLNVTSNQQRDIPVTTRAAYYTSAQIHQLLLTSRPLRDILYYHTRKLRIHPKEGIQVNHPSFTSPLIFYPPTTDPDQCQMIYEHSTR